jgi:hypothetical protein
MPPVNGRYLKKYFAWPSVNAILLIPFFNAYLFIFIHLKMFYKIWTHKSYINGFPLLLAKLVGSWFHWETWPWTGKVPTDLAYSKATTTQAQGLHHRVTKGASGFWFELTLEVVGLSCFLFFPSWRNVKPQGKTIAKRAWKGYLAVTKV